MAGRIREPADLWLRRFTARYASVPRFVVMLRGTSPPEARAVITTAPGEEGQVELARGPRSWRTKVQTDLRTEEVTK